MLFTTIESPNFFTITSPKIPILTPIPPYITCNSEKDRVILCCFENCDYKSPLPENLTKHITVKHDTIDKEGMAKPPMRRSVRRSRAYVSSRPPCRPIQVSWALLSTAQVIVEVQSCLPGFKVQPFQTRAEEQTNTNSNDLSVCKNIQIISIIYQSDLGLRMNRVYVV